MEKSNFGIKLDDDAWGSLDPFIHEQMETRKKLHQWQQEAIDYFFNNDCHAIFFVATGTGKSYCAIQIIKEVWNKHPDMRILVIVPKNVILERTWYTELVENGVPYYDIGIFYGKIKEYAKITLTNMQSMDVIDCEKFDFCIYDEIHNYGSERMMYYVKYGFKYKLGLTATIERMDNMHETMIREFNYNIFKYMPMEALADKVLNDFDFTDVIVELDTNSRTEYEKIEQKINLIYAQFGGYSKCMKSTSSSKFALLKLLHERNKIVNNYPDKFEVIKKICADRPEAKIIIFNQYNDQTNKCYWHLCDIGIRARTVHSGINPKERNQVLDDFKNNIFNVLLTSKVLDEGYNLPQIDVGIMMAGDSTKKQTVQRMGRVLRKKLHKSELIQIYCDKTIEERNSIERGKLFKGLASNYKKYRYDKYNNQLAEEV